MATMLDSYVKCMRGNLAVCANSDREAWAKALCDAWLKGYEEARACERENSDCDSDTIITLVDTRTNADKPMSVTLERVSVVCVEEGVSVTVSTQYNAYTILIDTAHTEVYSKRKYYFDD